MKLQKPAITFLLSTGLMLLAGCGGSTSSTGTGSYNSGGIPVPTTSPSPNKGAVSGQVLDANGQPMSGVQVSLIDSVQGKTVTTTNSSQDGSFAFTSAPIDTLRVAAAAPNASYLGTETRQGFSMTSNGNVSGQNLTLSARPSDNAQYIGGLVCAVCHASTFNNLATSAHYRSLTRILRDPTTGNATTVTGTNTLFQSGGATNALQVGDELGYTPVGLGWTKIGSVASVDNDTQVTLTAKGTFAPGVTSIANSKYSVKRLSRSYTTMLPQDSNDIVAPAWPGVKATNPNYDCNDPRIYGSVNGQAQYSDGQVNVYLVNLKDGVKVLNDDYAMKFGGLPYTASDGSFYDGVNTPAVPMVHIEVIYGGQGDKDGQGNPHPNMGVFKQRFQGRLADVKATQPWNYTTGKNLDSLTLPIQILESGDKVNGGYKMNGYHPTEQKFPGESWSQRSRTFSHACAGCHNIGLQLDYDMVTVTLPFGRDGAPNNSPFTFAAIKSYSFIDENLTCEHCHGPGSEHRTDFGKGKHIINPKYLTPEAELQLCGQCHGFDDGYNAKPLQDYGFEFGWNTDNANKVGNSGFVPGVYDISTFFANWDERNKDDEGFWDPTATNGTLYGQAHRQQYTMLEQSSHVTNPNYKTTCTSCHDPHTQYLGTTNANTTSKDQYSYLNADYRDNVECLSCHSGGTPWASASPDVFANITKDDVANQHIADGGVATKNGQAITPSSDQITASKANIASVVQQHMAATVNMVAPYTPTNDTNPSGRCTSCHMPKVAKSGGYYTGPDANNNTALIEGDQASHVFDVIMPNQYSALSRGGPSFQSGYYGQFISPTNIKYDLFGYMPNSCGKCHQSMRQASIAIPDITTVWPTFWPYNEHQSDPTWTNAYKSTTAP